MQWHFQDDRPIWIQLTEQLTAGIVAGDFPSGSRLPTVRELAAQAGVNPNTAQRALSQLEAEALAVSERGTGRTVTCDTAVIDGKRRHMAQGIAQAYLQQMRDLGFTAQSATEYLTTQGGQDT